MRTIKEELGYTVVYDTTYNTVGYISIDDSSGGYPYFSDRPDSRNVFVESSDAVKLLETSKTMKTFYKADKVKFDTMRIVKITRIIEDVNITELGISIRKSIMNKLSKEEIAFIKSDFNET